MSASLTIFLFVHIWLSSSVAGTITIETHGDPLQQCNLNPSQFSIDPLPANDHQLIHKLEQIQVFHRHGARVGTTSISSMFSNASHLEYHCNISTVETTEYKQHHYYTNASKPMLNIRKLYIRNEEFIEGNCQFMQSTDALISQLAANAQHLLTTYIGNSHFHLFNHSTLINIAHNLSLHSEDARVSFHVTDFERTIASLIALVSEFFSSAIQHTNNVSLTLNTNLHDVHSDPYNPTRNDICMNHQQYKQWNDKIRNDDKLKNTQLDDIINSKFGQDTIEQFEREGGIWSANTVGLRILFPYCAGVRLPLSNATFWNVVKLSYNWTASYFSNVNTSYAMNKSKCVNRFMAIPMLNVILQHINKMKNDRFHSKLVFHSIHDTSIGLLLKALNVWDDVLIIFGELVTLEIYSKKEDINSYLFRITRKGKFVPYPLCDYKDGDTELCDLDVMLDDAFSNVVSQSIWANDWCATLIDDCRCGYCKDNDEGCGHEDGWLTISLWVGISIGLLGGVLLVLLAWFVWKLYTSQNTSELVTTDYISLNQHKM